MACGHGVDFEIPFCVRVGGGAGAGEVEEEVAGGAEDGRLEGGEEAAFEGAVLGDCVPGQGLEDRGEEGGAEVRLVFFGEGNGEGGELGGDVRCGGDGYVV